MAKVFPGYDEVGEEDPCVSIPLGGPIFVQDMVGPPTSVPEFETSVRREIQSLKEVLSGESSESLNEEISVDELKIISEDELVEKAFEEAFKVDELAVSSPQVTKEHLNTRSDGKGAPVPEHGSQSSEGDMKAIVLSELPNALPIKTRGNKKSNKNTSRKRKCGSKTNNSFDECYIEKVEELVRIKKKQEEDKAAVRLHSFKASTSGTFSKVDKIRSLKSASVSRKVRASNTCDNVPVGIPETVLCVEVYHDKKTWLKTQEFLVLGGQFLTEVKDKIHCLTDEIMKKAGQYDSSGYFLIEDVFYNDMRDSYAVDYSKPILDWRENSKSDAHEKWEFLIAGESQKRQKVLLADGKKQQLPKFKSVQMQCTKFCNLTFRPGARYLYCHQGDCKHAIVIRDLRLIHQEDVQNRRAYPLITFQTKFRRRKCSVCKIYRAVKMTVDDKWAAKNPCYFCDVCYYMLHYGNGSLLYSDFRVYDYHQDI